MAGLDLLCAKPAGTCALGATPDAGGVTFTLYSERAIAVTLYLFASNACRAFSLQKGQDNLWSVYIENAQAGLLYAYRVESGEGYGVKNAAGLVLDPYAREVVGSYVREEQANSAHGLLAKVVDEDDFDWAGDKPPRIPMADTVLYEAHLKGVTKQLAGAAPQGTYAAIASSAFIDHVKALGVTSIDFLPLTRFIDEDRLLTKGLTNFWGYNPVSFFAPETRYAVNPEFVRTEMREMIKALHAAGLEVILDVVFNHTGETDELGPTLSLRGIDNAAYYRVRGERGELYENHTGCGNTLNASHPVTLRLIVDALTYWVKQMHVDGFRFDLARTLLRDSQFLEAIKNTPALEGIKLIAEPWDIGPDGYALGRFPSPWSEWNDRFRDDVRDFWLTKNTSIGTFATRLCASSDVFRREDRLPQACVNFITAHDGFTLTDLVSYVEKHNEANGEENRDGTMMNRSINCGQEGPSKQPGVNEKRGALKRALLATLFFSQGVPMLLAGDEMGHTQGGNNNAYCMDNETTWLEWPDKDEALVRFVSRLTQLRKAFPQFKKAEWLTGQASVDVRDIVWLDADAREMTSDVWNRGGDTLAMRLAGVNGSADILLFFNRSESAVDYALPEGEWKLELDSRSAAAENTNFRRRVTLSPLSVTLLSLSQEVEYPRQSGMLMHVTSLPGGAGIGDMGHAARAFVDWLKTAKQSIWQVLPVTVTGEGNSPYMGASVFAGNELLIDLDDLKRRGWLKDSDLSFAPVFPEGTVDYETVAAYKYSRLRLAAKRFFSSWGTRTEFKTFLKREESWLEDYALFRSLEVSEGARGRICWQDWPEAVRRHDPVALVQIKDTLADEVNFWLFAQWIFDKQWRDLHRYARQMGIAIVGDMPLYVSLQSADVWAHQELFDLNSQGEPLSFAGVPPDYFSSTGQFWGNPLYRWENHRKEHYAWFTARFKRADALYDVVRIDHFRGFESYWEIPFGAMSAVEGAWKKGPGSEVFEAFGNSEAAIDFIAEDLGTITKEVDALREKLNFPGMRVLEFGFDGKRENPHALGNVLHNVVYYTGTHDNDTLVGWYESLTDEVRQAVNRALGCTRETLVEKAITAIYASRARIVITPIQDPLGLSSEHRMNRPGEASNAWRWRLKEGLLTPSLAWQLAQLVKLTRRN